MTEYPLRWETAWGQLATVIPAEAGIQACGDRVDPALAGLTAMVAPLPGNSTEIDTLPVIGYCNKLVPMKVGAGDKADE